MWWHWSETDNDRQDHAKVAGQKIACPFWVLAFTLEDAHWGNRDTKAMRKEGSR